MCSNCTGDVNAGNGISGWYQLLVPHEHKYDKIGYVEVPEDHLYNTQNSERSDEVSPYLMVACVQVPVRKLLLLLLLFFFFFLSLLLLLLSLSLFWSLLLLLLLLLFFCCLNTNPFLVRVLTDGDYCTDEGTRRTYCCKLTGIKEKMRKRHAFIQG